MLGLSEWLVCLFVVLEVLYGVYVLDGLFVVGCVLCEVLGEEVFYLVLLFVWLLLEEFEVLGLVVLIVFSMFCVGV